jgi:type IV secretion system protein TrbL
MTEDNFKMPSNFRKIVLSLLTLLPLVFCFLLTFAPEGHAQASPGTPPQFQIPTTPGQPIVNTNQQTAQALAANDGNNFIDSFVGQYSDNAKGWEAPLKGYAARIFWLLALIEIVWVMKDLVIGQASLDDWLMALLQHLIVLGFFWNMLVHASDLAGAIINSMKLAGNAANLAAGGVKATGPSDIFDAGVDIAFKAIQSFDWTKLGDSIAIVLASIMICISFALVAALQSITMVEGYVFTYAGVIFLGFGASGVTRYISMAYLRGALSIGAKLLVIQLIVGLGKIQADQWHAQITADNALFNLRLLLDILGGSVLFLAFAKMAPDFVQGLMSGNSTSTMGTMISSAMALGSITQSVGQGVASGIASAFGQGEAAEKFGQGSANHANEAFRHSTGEYALTNQQSMPYWFDNDNKKQNDSDQSGKKGGAFRFETKPKANTIAGSGETKKDDNKEDAS